MKKTLSLILILATLLCMGNCCAAAESTSSYTADELAYSAYCSLGSAYHARIVYLEYLDGLWESLIGIDSFKEINYDWVIKYVAANMDVDESIQRSLLLVKLANKKFGTDDAQAFMYKGGFVNALKAEAEKRQITDPRAVMWLTLGWAEECEILKSKESIDQLLEYGMEDIRRIMSIDRNYAELDMLKDYYKEVSQIHKYTSDFSDNYINFQKNLKQYQSSYDSWEIDFDFVFGTDSYATYGDAYRRLCKERGVSPY